MIRNLEGGDGHWVHTTMSARGNQLTSPGADSGINVTSCHLLRFILGAECPAHDGHANGSCRAEGWTCREEGSLCWQGGMTRAQSGAIRLSINDISESGQPPWIFRACHLPAVVGMYPK